MAESSHFHVYPSTPLHFCNAQDTSSTTNIGEDSGYHSNSSGYASTNSSSIIYKPLNSINESANIFTCDKQNFVGRRYIDFILNLGECHHMILKNILSQLSDEDLHNCSLVSKMWRDIITTVPSEEKRLRIYMKKRELNKENREKNSSKKSNPHEEIRCLTILTPRHKLVQIQNIQESSASSSSASPRPMYNGRFEAYQREGQKVAIGKRLYSCPKCLLPSHVDPNRSTSAVCTNSLCAYRFCTTCQFEEHLNKPCYHITTPIVKKRSYNIGTAKSKKNLKRLLK